MFLLTNYEYEVHKRAYFYFILHFLGKRCGKAAQRGLQEADKPRQGGERAQAPGIMTSPRASVGRRGASSSSRYYSQPNRSNRKESELKLQVL